MKPEREESRKKEGSGDMALDCAGTEHARARVHGEELGQARPPGHRSLDSGACFGYTLCRFIVLSRDHVCTWPGEFPSNLTKHKHPDIADKLKFIETDKNAPTQDYS